MESSIQAFSDFWLSLSKVQLSSSSLVVFGEVKNIVQFFV